MNCKNKFNRLYCTFKNSNTVTVLVVLVIFIFWVSAGLGALSLTLLSISNAITILNYSIATEITFLSIILLEVYMLIVKPFTQAVKYIYSTRIIK